MASSATVHQSPLKPGWEEVTADDGRTYYWNSDTDETTWERPSVPILTTRKSTSVATRISELLEGDDPSRVAADLLFKFYDRDGNKVLDSAETGRMLNDYGFSDEQSLLLHELIDADGDGTLTFDEFWEWLQQKDKLDLVRDDTRFHLLKEAGHFFKAADVDGDGHISREELAQALRREWGKTEAEANDIVDAIDADGNANVSLYEYISFLAGFPGWESLLPKGRP